MKESVAKKVYDFEELHFNNIQGIAIDEVNALFAKRPDLVGLFYSGEFGYMFRHKDGTKTAYEYCDTEMQEVIDTLYSIEDKVCLGTILNEHSNTTGASELYAERKAKFEQMVGELLALVILQFEKQKADPDNWGWPSDLLIVLNHIGDAIEGTLKPALSTTNQQQ
jgi:hypothetical protein